MRLTNRTLVPALLAAALLCPLAVRQAEAQSARPRPPIAGVQVVVRDLSTQQDLGTVPPGGTISVPAGSHLRLIMTAIPTGNRAPLYPATVYRDQSQGGVRITRSRSENSTADLDVGETKGRRSQGISYQIEEDWVPANLRNGSIYLQVVPAAVAPDVGAALSGSARAQELTRMLYQAILLREPDPGAQGTVDSIDRGGYDAVVQAAVGIANSDESRNRVRASNEDRLSSLYQNLLGMSPDQVDRAQYEGDLRRLASGRIADVVSGMVQSARFQSRARVGSNRY
ncbi:MAG TPA: DUF4214 domain-containing protein [Thermoanaerobaculia bacterium]|nr:DUF4214 domain-containing protein [Thermoanaerobaculia bacterium]